MRSCFVLYAACLLGFAACASVNRGLINTMDTVELKEGERFLVTMGDLPADTYTPLGLVHAKRHGYYFLWLIPIVRSNLDHALYQRLIDEARKMGADAVIRASFSYDSFPTFPASLVTLGNVHGTAIDGMAVKRKPKPKS